MATQDRRLLKWILFLSIVLNIVAAAYVGKKLYNKYTAKPDNRLPQTPAYYLGRDKVFEVLPKDSNGIVFLGNSHTQYFELAELLQNPQVKNRGIHGDMITGVMARLSPIIAMQPIKMFIEIGINDVEQKVSKEDLLKQYGRLIDTLKTTCPLTKIYIQSLLPVANMSAKTPSYCSPEMNKKIVEINTELKRMATNKGCTFIDVHSRMLSNDELNPVYSFEGLHLSAEGYVAWAKVLKPYVEE